ncbi:FUSC family protein, partial [Myxococcota bacterium]|nr:FUSC family protein [Myxococcota bacterium]
RLTHPETSITDPALEQLSPSGPMTPLPEEPREALNAGLSALEAEQFEQAQSLFERARQTARGDGEVRYRATYNLGWLEVARADSLLEQEPAQALTRLQRSADWFQEAVDLRPQAEAPRRNLEIVLARILILSDQLAEQSSESLEQRLTRLIEGQRSINQSLREVSETLQFIEDPHASDAWRPVFRRLAVEERKWLDEARGLSESAATEQLNLEKQLADPPNPEDAMRRFQLEAAQLQLHRARERMGQARQQLRRRSATRAHRRGALALERLKRSREQLQDPVVTLDGLLRDGAQLHGDTQRLVSDATPRLRDSESKIPNRPPWLTADYLIDRQTSITERSAELDERFTAGANSRASSADPEQSARQEQIQATAPFLTEAHQAFDTAQAALVLDDFVEAERNQRAGLTALAQAREQLLDLRGLIELTYRDEARLAQAMGAKPQPSPDSEPKGLKAYWMQEASPAWVALQTRNLERTQRLGLLIEQARHRAENPAPPRDAATLKAESERLDTADGLLAMTEASMRGALKALHQIGEDANAPERSRRSIASAVKGLEGLRRLFFSLVEHVRDALRQQQGLSDATNSAAGREKSEKNGIIGPVAQQQEALGNKTESLAETLHEQALEAVMSPENPAGPDTRSDPEATQADSERLSQAAEQVLEAAGEMSAAAAALARVGETLDAARKHQTRSEQALQEAIALLNPPPPPSDESTEPEASPSPQESESQTAQASPTQPETSSPGENGDLGQVLQAVREREAERHRRRRPPSGYEPVDRDW